MRRNKKTTAIALHRKPALLPEATRLDCQVLGLSQEQVENICYLAGMYGSTPPHLVRWIKEGVKPDALGYCLEIREYIASRTEAQVSPVTLYQCLEELGFHWPDAQISVPEGKQLLDGHAVTQRQLVEAEFNRIVNGELPPYRPVLLDDGSAEVIETFIETASSIRCYEVDPLKWVLRRVREAGLDIQEAYHLAVDDPKGFERLLRGTSDLLALRFRSLDGLCCSEDGHWHAEEDDNED